MKLLLLALSLFTLTASASIPAHHAKKHVAAKHQTYVYICNSKGAYAYHSNPDCEGLRRCTHGVLKITLEEAEKMGRKPCHYCYK